MLRMPEPRPFMQLDRQRPKLANALMLGVFSPCIVVMGLVILMSLYGFGG